MFNTYKIQKYRYVLTHTKYTIKIKKYRYV